MELLAGTSGFSYKSWKGPFYPEDLPAGKMLETYATRLPAVEINNTFYRLPRASVLTSWADQVPPSFRFSLKASRRITHFKRLKDAADPTGYLLEAVESLGERLGVLLFQLPPHFPRDLDRLQAFLDVLPPGTPAAFEFRHDSWHEPETYERLQARNMAVCASDTTDKPAGPLVKTASWGYLRLRRSDYDDAALAAWAARVEEQGWEKAFLFFKHEEAGAGPRMALRFLKVAGADPSR